MEDILNELSAIAELGYLIKGIAGLFSLYGVGRFIYDFLWYNTVKLSVGSFKVKHKNYNYQDVTNIVSTLFYNGGRIDESVRREILEQLNPKVKDLKRKDYE